MHITSTARTNGECTSCKYRNLRMFCNLSEAALADFDAIGMQMTLPKGAILFREDDSPTGVFVLCQGQAKLSCASREGKTLILRIAHPGDVLGLGAVISNSRAEVTAETIEPATIKKIRKNEFLDFLSRHSEASMHAARTLSEEYKTAFFDARRLALSGTAAGRLASVLLDWGSASGCGDHELRFTMALTHEELANVAGVSRETITRMLGKFQREKLISVHGSTIHILQPEKLADFCA